MMSNSRNMARVISFLYLGFVPLICLVHAIPDTVTLSWSSGLVTCPEGQLVVVEELFYASPRPEVCNPRCRMGANVTSADLCYFHRGQCVQRAPQELVHDVYKTCRPSPSQPVKCDVAVVDRRSLTVGYICLSHAIFLPFNRTFSWKADALTLLAVHSPRPAPQAQLAVCHVAQTLASPVTLTTLVFPDPSGDGPPPATSSSVSSSSSDVSQSWRRVPASSTPRTGPAVTSPSRDDVRAAERVVFVLAGGERRRLEPSRYPRWLEVWEKEFVLEFYAAGGGESSPPLWVTLEGSSHQQVEVRCSLGEVTTTTTTTTTTSATSPRPANTTSLIPAAIGAGGHTSFTLLELLVAVGVAVLGVAGLALGAFLVYRHRRRNVQIDNPYDVLVPPVTYHNDGTNNGYVNTPNGVSTSERFSNGSRPEPPRPRTQRGPQEVSPPSRSCANHTYGQTRECAQQKPPPEFRVSDDCYLKPRGLAETLPLRPFLGLADSVAADDRLGADDKKEGCAETHSDGNLVSTESAGGGDAYDEIPACKGDVSLKAS